LDIVIAPPRTGEATSKTARMAVDNLLEVLKP